LTLLFGLSEAVFSGILEVVEVFVIEDLREDLNIRLIVVFAEAFEGAPKCRV
jgi:hypothetical protein